MEVPRHPKRLSYNLDFPVEQYVSKYYQPFVDLIEHSDTDIREVGEDRFILVQLDELDMIVGLDSELVGIVRHNPEKAIAYPGCCPRPGRSRTFG